VFGDGVLAAAGGRGFLPWRSAKWVREVAFLSDAYIVVVCET